jgi:hypothetical protein
MKTDMASTSETGYPVYVANLGTFIKFVTAYGPKYNPAKANLKLPGLTTIHADAESKLRLVKTAGNNYSRAVQLREFAFTNAKKLASKMLSGLPAAGASKATLEFAKPINKKIQGTAKSATRVSEPSLDGEPVEVKKRNSVSQQSYTRIADHFDQLIETIFGDPEYAPNEPEYQRDNLTAMVADMRSKSAAADIAEAALSQARNERDIALFAEPNGVCIVGSEGKGYVRSVFGSSSNQFKNVTKLNFPKKKI